MRNYINLIESFVAGQPTRSRSEVFKVGNAPASLGNWVDITVECFDKSLRSINLIEHKSLRDIDVSPLRYIFEGVEIFSVKLHDSTCLVAIDAERLDNSILYNLNEEILSELIEVIKQKTGLDVVGITDDIEVSNLFKSIQLPILI